MPIRFAFLLCLAVLAPVTSYAAYGECESVFSPTKLTAWQETKRATQFLIHSDHELELVGSRGQIFVDSVYYYFGIPKKATQQIAGLGLGLFQVEDLMRIRPMPSGMLPADHPWVTGINPRTGSYIWPENVLFATEKVNPDFDDRAMLVKVGTFLTGQVEKSVPVPEIPQGPKRRMPHVVNYIHGTSQFNSAILIFNNIKEAFEHFSDRRFRQEIKRFHRDQNREILIYFRNKDYDVQEYARFVAYIRVVLPWFANSDGPKKTVLWGNPAPYPVVNILTGDWARDLYALRKQQDLPALARPPIAREGYFADGPYRGVRVGGSRWPERVVMLYAYYRIKARGARGGHSTMDRRLVDKPGSNNYEIAPIYEDPAKEPRDDEP